MRLFLTVTAAIAAILCLLYVLSLRGRKNGPDLAPFRGFAYAHRGLYGDGIPENSLAAFRAARDRGYGIELDVHLLKDGSLAIMHDSALMRTTGREGILEDLTAGELPGYPLEGTEETIPLFRDVLDLFGGKAPMIVELKPRGDNVDALCLAACRMLDGYRGAWCLESFDPRCVLWLKRNRPDLIRGQLAEDFRKSPFLKNIPVFLKFLMTHNIPNFITKPDFIAYRYRERRILSNFLCLRLWHMQGVSWTLQTREEYDTAVKEGWIPIFEHFLP